LCPSGGAPLAKDGIVRGARNQPVGRSDAAGTMFDSGHAPESGRTLEITGLEHYGPWALELGSEASTQAVPLDAGRELVLGSSPAADVRVEDRAVSSRHCSVQVRPHAVLVRDLGSKNGTFVGSGRVPAAELRGDGAAFVIGRTSVRLCRTEDLDAAPPGAPLDGLVGGSAAMLRVAAEVRRHARLKAPVLIQGESGTGKDVVARCLHDLSGRSGSYVPLNVGALQESLADAELFGHRRGAFTGAVANRPGAFEQAHGGSLFLDEIADLAPSIQVKLLRIVEDGLLRPLGATRPMQVDVRVVSASWASLEERVQQGRFRADLFHRLSTVVLRLPPLRSRTSDIPALSAALLQRIAGETGRKRLTSAALGRLVSYPWPGNVRELFSVLYRAAVASAGPNIDAAHIKLESAPRASHGPGAAERALLILAQHHGNVSAAARAAGVARSTFRSWLERARAEGAEADA